MKNLVSFMLAALLCCGLPTIFTSRAQGQDKAPNNAFPSAVGTYYEVDKSYKSLASKCPSDNEKPTEEKTELSPIVSGDHPAFVFVIKDASSAKLESLKLLRVSTIRFNLEFSGSSGSMKMLGDTSRLGKAEVVKGRERSFRVRVA